MTIPTTVHQQQQTPSASFGRNVCCVLALRRLGEAVTSSELGQKARAKSGISDGFSRVLVAKTILCIIFSLGIFWIVVHIVAWRAHRDGAHGLLAPFWAALTAEDLGAQQLQIQQQEEASNFSVTEVDTSAEQSPDDDATAHAAQPPEQGQAEETGANQQPPPPPLHQIFQSAPFTPQGSAGSTLRQPSAQAGASSLPAAPSKVATPQPSGVSTSSAPGSDVSSADDADGNSERPDGDSSSPRDIAADPIAIVSEANPSSPIADESPESDAVADADSTSSPTVDGSPESIAIASPANATPPGASGSLGSGLAANMPGSPLSADSNFDLGAQALAGGANDSSTPNSDVSSAASSADKPKSPDGDSTATHDIDQDPIVIVAETKPPLTITAENPESSAVAGET
ncbi:MAG: hypothetical protein LBI39_02605, partial [Puniceicoccales bacterium]|nr:hypothetical protein [Puniceicoccales bacterium]